MRGQPYRGLRRFISTMALMSSPDGPFGFGFLPSRGEYRRRYFRFFNALWNESRVDGLMMTADLSRHLGFRNQESGPVMTGSPIIDYATGLMAAFAVSAALMRQVRTGQGEITGPSRAALSLVFTRPAWPRCRVLPRRGSRRPGWLRELSVNRTWTCACTHCAAVLRPGPGYPAPRLVARLSIPNASMTGA